MPLTFATGAALALNEQFQNRVATAMYYVARGIIANAEDPAIGAERRKQLARAILLTPLPDLRKYSVLVATDPIIVRDFPTVEIAQLNQALVTDQHLINAITSAWNALADVQLG